MVLEMIRWGRGGWSGRADAHRRPRVSKLRDKGLSDYHANETVVEAARQGASGPNKRDTLTTYLLKKGEVKSSSLPDGKKGKRQPAREKGQQIKKKDCLL
jgi:hypothetical protein